MVSRHFHEDETSEFFLHLEIILQNVVNHSRTQQQCLWATISFIDLSMCCAYRNTNIRSFLYFLHNGSLHIRINPTAADIVQKTHVLTNLHYYSHIFYAYYNNDASIIAVFPTYWCIIYKTKSNND